METLVLSHAYQPVDRISWQRAVTLWATDRVQVVETYDDRLIRSVSITIRMPSVVSLHLPDSHYAARREVLARERLLP